MRVPVQGGAIDASVVDAIAHLFEARYEALYGRGTAYGEAGIEMVTFGVDAIGRIETARIPSVCSSGADLLAARAPVGQYIGPSSVGFGHCGL